MMSPASTEFIRRLRKLTADRSLLKALPVTTCAICTDDFVCKDELVRLPTCRHLFHRNCILPWFSRTNTCPLCRHVFPAEQPKRHSVRLRSHPLYIRPQSTMTEHVFHLHFHLRPQRPSNSVSPPSSTPTGRLEEMLVTEGYLELAARACGPFWVSVDRISNLPPAVVTDDPAIS